MKKVFTLVLLALAIMIVAVSCDDPKPGESPVKDVTVDVDIIKAFSADEKYIFALDDGIVWKYTAEKLDKGYTTGASKEETVLKSDELTLSVGSWKIALYGYSGESLIWSGKLDEVTLLDSNTDIKVTLTSSVEENGKLFETVDAAFAAIKDSSNKNVTLYVLKDEVKLGKDLETLIGSDCAAYTITFDGGVLEKPVVETRITRDAGHSDKSLYLCGHAGLVFKNITVKIGDASTFQGFGRASKLVFEDCTIVGRGSYWSEDTTFTNCAFSVSGDWVSDIYIPGTYVFDNCTFNSPDGEFINIYTDNTALTKDDCIWNITVRNCSFTGNTTAKEGKGRPVFVIKTGKATPKFNSCTINFEGTNTFKGTINEYGTGCPKEKLGDYADLFAAFGDKSGGVYTWDTVADVTLKSNGSVVYKGSDSQN